MQSPYKGLDKSISYPFYSTVMSSTSALTQDWEYLKLCLLEYTTLAATASSASLLEICLAIFWGVVTNDSPLIYFPPGRVMVISFLSAPE